MKYFVVKCKARDYVSKFDEHKEKVTWKNGSGSFSEVSYTQEEYDFYIKRGIWIPCDEYGNILKNKPLRPLENWIQTISSKKFERCVGECTELVEGIFYNEDTKCLYLHYNPLKGYTVNDEGGLPTRVNFSHKSEALKEAVKFIEVQKVWKEALSALDKKKRDINKIIPREEDFSTGSKFNDDGFVTNFDKPAAKTEWTDKHYDFTYKLSQEEIEKGEVQLDVYKVAKVWRTGSKDDSGALWHSLKTIARFGDKNPVEREIRALYEQVKGLARENGVDLDE